MTNNNNTTSIIERPKEETAIMEHPMSEDDLTHPGLYRFKRNSIPCYTFRGNNRDASKPTGNKSESKSDMDWDLYPGLMRGIENNGSPEQVKKLHEMQQN